MSEPGVSGEPQQTGVLVDGRLVSLSADAVLVTTRDGQVLMRVHVDEITSVGRGGADVVIVRGGRDPVSITFMRMEDATAFVRALRVPPSRRAQEVVRQRTWWAFWRRL